MFIIATSAFALRDISDVEPPKPDKPLFNTDPAPPAETSYYGSCGMNKTEAIIMGSSALGAAVVDILGQLSKDPQPEPTIETNGNAGRVPLKPTVANPPRITFLPVPVTKTHNLPCGARIRK